MRDNNIPILGEEDEPEPSERGMTSLLVPVPRADNPRLSQIDFEPLQNWCLVQELDGAVELPSGILVPEAYGQTFRKGLVLCTGKGTVFSSGTFIECCLHVGDVILYGKAAGLEVTIKEGAFKLIRESEIFGKIPSGVSSKST